MLKAPATNHSDSGSSGVRRRRVATVTFTIPPASLRGTQRRPKQTFLGGLRAPSPPDGRAEARMAEAFFLGLVRSGSRSDSFRGPGRAGCTKMHYSPGNRSYQKRPGGWAAPSSPPLYSRLPSPPPFPGTDLPLKGQIFHREAENRLSRRPRDEKKLNFK